MSVAGPPRASRSGHCKCSDPPAYSRGFSTCRAARSCLTARRAPHRPSHLQREGWRKKKKQFPWLLPDRTNPLSPRAGGPPASSHVQAALLGLGVAATASPRERSTVWRSNAGCHPEPRGGVRRVSVAVMGIWFRAAKAE